MKPHRILTATVLLALLASCGVDGPPKPPEPRDEAQTGATITLSGESGVGVVGGS